MTKVRGSLDYYVQRELVDEPGRITRFHHGPGDTTRSAVDALETLRSAAVGVRAPIKALDFTIAAPKSVSVQWALAGDEGRAALEQAHRDAVARTFELMLEMDSAKLGADGTVRAVRDVVAYEVGHRLSRSGDPHLHSHLVVINRARVGERVVALDHARWARGLEVYELCYRVELAYRLRGLGVELSGRGLGSWHVVGQHPGLISLFSKRRAQVLARVGDPSQSQRSRQIAVFQTRAPKVQRRESELRQQWRREVERTPLPQPEHTTVEIDDRGTVRVNDPVLNEIARSIERGADSIDAARSRALRAIVGDAKADILLREGHLELGSQVGAFDGTICQTYRALTVPQRLNLMEIRTDRVQMVEASREVVPLIGALEGAGIESGGPVNVLTRTANEGKLIAGLGQYRRSSFGPSLVVDANALAPSELHELVTSARTVIRSPSAAPAELPSATVLGLAGCEGGSLFVAQSSVALWNAFVSDCTRWVQSGCKEALQVLTPSAGLSAKVRREVADRAPEAVVGYIGHQAIFLGEPVLVAGGQEGVVLSCSANGVDIKIGEDSKRVAVSDVMLVGFGTRGDGRRAIMYGPGNRDEGLTARRYVCQPRVEELAREFVRERGADGVAWIADGVVGEISRARMKELSCNPRPSAEFYRLRSVTDGLSRIYDLAEEAGLDNRRGRDRILDERLGLLGHSDGWEHQREFWSAGGPGSRYV